MADRASGQTVGLRIDVDTYRGTRDGVPALLDVLGKHRIRASFFFSVGPDNMGRHLWRLANPAFLWKMLRSNAPSLYGWDILLRGTFWSGPNIGNSFPDIIRQTASDGHEVGLHAWDHHAWQTRLGKMSKDEIEKEVSIGMKALTSILGSAPQCSASAGWICSDAALAVTEKFRMRYQSDCRGANVFRPAIDGSEGTPQIPVTMPTYDELIGRDGVTDGNFNETLLNRIRPGQLNVLTIHAEVEGIAKLPLFRQFLVDAARLDIRFVPLGELLPQGGRIPVGRIEQGLVRGRQGRLCVQADVPA